jgi:hypothetical protein
MPATTQASTTGTGPVLVWESDFADGTLDGFRPATIDASIGCDKYPNEPSDVLAGVLDDQSAPSGRGKALELVANVNNRKGIFANALTARAADFLDDHIWYAYGFFRKSEIGQIQNTGVNLQLIQNYIERPVLMQWVLNRYDNLYESVILYVWKDGAPTKVEVHKLPDDEKWHYFEIEGTYSSNDDRRITRVRIDQANLKVSYEMVYVKQAWQSSFQLILETNNFWTNCNPSISTQGISHWSKVGLVKELIM